MTERLMLTVSAAVLQSSLKDANETIERLTAENLNLEREIGKARLLADMRRQLHEFKLSADGPFLPPPFQRQGE